VLEGKLALEEVVSHVIELREVESALERLRRGEGARSVVVVDERLAGWVG
jgi:Zn-dependent alcohol dehydrogenase